MNILPLPLQSKRRTSQEIQALEITILGTSCDTLKTPSRRLEYFVATNKTFCRDKRIISLRQNLGTQ